PGAEPDPATPQPSSCEPQPVPEPAPPPAQEPLPEPPPPDLDPHDPDEDDDGLDDAEERAAFELALTKRTMEAMAAQATLPTAIECAEPVNPRR
ncbi:MAG TPA: hypothetical protein VHF58_11925, partial [Solirubrobacterales bacterium]|nr:hypothetical protein [Solirubrobacterales bacterium]